MGSAKFGMLLWWCCESWFQFRVSGVGARVRSYKLGTSEKVQLERRQKHSKFGGRFP